MRTLVQLRSHIAGKHIKTREKALEEFFRFHEAYNGNRRKKPKEFIKVVRVRATVGGGFDIHYSVPARVLKL